MFSLTKIVAFSISALLVQITLATPVFNSLKSSDSIIIRHVESGLVVDGSEHLVKLEKFTNSSSQIWNPVQKDLFSYAIYNGNTKLALSVGGTLRNDSKVTTEAYSSVNQEWIITGNNFVVYCPDTHFILDVHDAKSYLGADLVVTYDESNAPVSKFELEIV